MPAGQKVNPEFDQYAASYDELLADPLRGQFASDPLHFHRRKWLLIQGLLMEAGVKPQSLKWADIGCGRGELLELAGEHFASAIGCDLSASMLASCTQFPVKQQTAETELPFADATVDFVTAVCVYHHVRPDARVQLTREIRRILTPHGIFCLIEHNPWNPVTLAIVRRCPVDADAKLLTSTAAGALLRDCDFGPVLTENFLYLPEHIFNQFPSLERMISWMPLGGQYAVVARTAA